MNDVSGTFTPGLTTGVAGLQNKYSIQSGTETSLGSTQSPYVGRPYVALSIGMGFHFDLLGD